MGNLKRVRAALGVAIVGLLVVALAPPGVAARQAQASLSVSPGIYVAGQKLTFVGNIGQRGVQRLRMQVLSGRPGDPWTQPEKGVRTWTNRDGSFRFSYPAPAMRGLRVRMASASAVTPAVPLNARSQDLVLDTPGQVLAGQPFVIDVDTTPRIAGRPDLPGPAFPGRTLTLQQRVLGDQWDDLDTTTTDQRGDGSFDVRVDQPGTVVYRVRQEDWTDGGDEVGWFPSFPTYVKVLGSGRTAAASTTSPTRQRGTQTEAGVALVESTKTRRAGRGATASNSHRWGRSLWDFAWLVGESLTSRPYRGTDRHGRWLDASDGSGRVSPHNGGLMLDSQRNVDGPGDYGTTTATLRGNPMRYGRWETTIRLKSPENNARDYRVRVELVPDQQLDRPCGVITVADVAAHGSSVTVGAKALKGTREWTYRKRIGSLMGPSVNFAVEVTRGHISWFVNGRAIATARSAAAVSDVPMTMRLVMVGAGQHEMNRTQAIFDWQRGFSLQRGKLTTNGHTLRQGTYAGC